MADYEPTNWSCGETITAERMNKIERGVADIMSEYVPTEWSCGDVITAEKLNKIEQAIANADCGGGSSDFSTAEVTITSNSMAAAVWMPVLTTVPNVGQVIMPKANPTAGTHTVLMDKDGAIAMVSSMGSEITTSGNITSLGDGAYLITGNCTINIDEK